MQNSIQHAMFHVKKYMYIHTHTYLTFFANRNTEVNENGIGGRETSVAKRIWMAKFHPFF